MKPKWQKLASLAKEECTLQFQFFGAVFASKDTLLRTYLIVIQSQWDHVGKTYVYIINRIMSF